VVLLNFSIILFSAFVGIQMWRQENATVPPRIARQRSIASGIYYAITTGGSLTVMAYHLPLWFQAVKGVGAVQSGIDVLPTALSVTVASAVAGFSTSRLGYYTPFMIRGIVLRSIGAGFITTFDPDTRASSWIAYQALFGFGIGLSVQQPSVAAQTVLTKEDVPIGAALMIFGQQLGSSLFVSVAAKVFSTRLVTELSTVDDLDPLATLNTGATDLLKIVPSRLLGTVVAAYNVAVTKAFVVAAALSVVSIFGALAMEWKNVKEKWRDPSPFKEQKH